MKFCPKCNRSYTDENLNFCLNDGEYLLNYGDDAPPTMVMDAPRITNQNWQQQPTLNEPVERWRNQPQNISSQPFGAPAFVQSADRTLPTIALVLGVLSILLTCCYIGLPLGLGALITGFLGMKNADNNPTRYGGRGLAIGGIVLGLISILSSMAFILFVLFAK